VITCCYYYFLNFHSSKILVRHLLKMKKKRLGSMSNIWKICQNLAIFSPNSSNDCWFRDSIFETRSWVQSVQQTDGSDGWRGLGFPCANCRPSLISKLHLKWCSVSRNVMALWLPRLPQWLHCLLFMQVALLFAAPADPCFLEMLCVSEQGCHRLTWLKVIPENLTHPCLSFSLSF